MLSVLFAEALFPDYRSIFISTTYDFFTFATSDALIIGLILKNLYWG